MSNKIIIQYKDRAGERFNRLVALKWVETKPHWGKKAVKFWLFRCDCGKQIIRPMRGVVRGDTKSCGCLKSKTGTKKIISLNDRANGISRTRFYRTWQNMKKRCYYKKSKDYKNYGKRGILVSGEWKNDFMAFYNDMQKSYLEHVEKHGEKDTTIDREDNDGNYCKENCRWATYKQQENNKRKKK